MAKKTHKFDAFDICERCGVERKKVPFVGNGYNPNFSNRFDILYSSDGKEFYKKYIDCEPKKPE